MNSFGIWEERDEDPEKAFERIFWGEARRIRAMGVYLHCLCVRMLIGSEIYFFVDICIYLLTCLPCRDLDSMNRTLLPGIDQKKTNFGGKSVSRSL